MSLKRPRVRPELPALTSDAKSGYSSRSPVGCGQLDRQSLSPDATRHSQRPIIHVEYEEPTNLSWRTPESLRALWRAPLFLATIFLCCLDCRSLANAFVIQPENQQLFSRVKTQQHPQASSIALFLTEVEVGRTIDSTIPSPTLANTTFAVNSDDVFLCLNDDGRDYENVSTRKETENDNHSHTLISLAVEDEDQVEDNATEKDDDDSTTDGDNNNTNDEAAQENAVDRRAALLARKFVSGTSRTKGRSARETSVGARRTGSATNARQGIRKTSQLMDTVRTAARGKAAAKEKKDPTASLATSKDIHAAIDDLLRRNAPTTKTFFKNEHTAAFSVSSFRSSDGRSLLRPGDVILGPSSPLDQTSVSIATPDDDVDVASLRLSVFSDFSPELQSQFHSRSCQALRTRRLRGAVCVTARMPRKQSPEEHTDPSDKGILIGSAECSYHEFFGTRLGTLRPANSIMYITEVAVSPSTRRRGVGYKLLQAMDRIAERRGVETLYLHVDVDNKSALQLYEKAGYTKLDLNETMYMEFTTALNLHPGATKGRDHHLLSKDLTNAPTWFDPEKEGADGSYGKSTASVLGFEIPA